MPRARSFPIEGDRLVAYELAVGNAALDRACGRSWSRSSATDWCSSSMRPRSRRCGPKTAPSRGSCRLPNRSRCARSGTTAGWSWRPSAGSLLAFRAIDGHLVWRRDLGSPAHAHARARGGSRLRPDARTGASSRCSVDGRRAAVGATPRRAAERDPRARRSRLRRLEGQLLLLSDGPRRSRRLALADRRRRRRRRRRRTSTTSTSWRSTTCCARSIGRAVGSSGCGRCRSGRCGHRSRWPGRFVVAGQSPTLRAFKMKDGTSGRRRRRRPLKSRRPPHVVENAFTGLPTVLIVTHDIKAGAARRS